jgi:hypothetical protein
MDDFYEKDFESIDTNGTAISMFELVLREVGNLPILSEQIEINDDEKRLFDAYNSASWRPQKTPVNAMKPRKRSGTII